MTEPYSKHLRFLLACTGIPLLAVALLNLLADPYASFGLLARTHFSHYAAGLGTRIGKGEMIASHDWDVLLLGTSRVQMGLDPAHPAFAGSRAYNCGLAGADFPELDHTARVAMKRGSLKRLILCVDLFSFNADWPAFPDAHQSRLNPDLDPLEYRLTNLLSPSATELSFKTAANALHGRDGDHYPLGLFTDLATLKPRNRSDWVLGGFFALTVPEQAQRSDLWCFSRARFQAMSDLLDEASRAGVRVDVVQLPTHAICLERFFACDRWPLYEGWLAALTDAVSRHNRRFPESPATFWDFCAYNSFTADVEFRPNRWFADPFHFKVDLGNLVLDRVMGAPSPAGIDLETFGLSVTEANLPAHLAQLRHDHQSYFDNNSSVRQVHKAVRESLVARGSVD